MNQNLGSGANPYDLVQAEVTGRRLLQQMQVEVGYLIHPHTRTCLYIGFLNRKDVRNYSGNIRREHWDGQLMTIRFSCDISSRYFDF
jgi:hypothetical protein